MKTIFLFVCFLLSNLLLAQSYYDGQDVTETVLTYYGFSDDQRKEKLIALSDSGNARAMYYLAKKYEHPNKSSFELIKESAGKGYFMAECELGYRYITGEGCSQNPDSAYYWLHKVIDYIKPYIDSDLKLYLKTIKSHVKCQLSVENERLATYSLANMILSQYYIEGGQKEQGLQCAKTGYNLMTKIYLVPKGWSPCDDIYKELFVSNWWRVVRYMAVAYYAVGDIEKGNKIYPPEYYEDIENNEPKDYIIGSRINRVYGYSDSGGARSIGLEYYRKAVEKNSYFAMRYMINDDPTTQKKVRQLAISGDSVAAMVYLHYKIGEKDTISANNFLKDLPYKFNFNFQGWHSTSSDKKNDYQNYLLEYDDVFFLLKQDALHTDTATILHLMDKYIDKFNHRIDAPKAACLYEILLSQHPDYNPQPVLKQNISACYTKISDYKKALPLMMEICDAYPDAYSFIGEILYEGYTGVPNYPKALLYLQKAEKQNENEMKSQTFYYLGMCYLKGNGVEKDEKRGFEYMKKAIECKTVLVKAFHQLSNCYRFGRGVEQDVKRAEELLEEASKYGDEDAKSLLDLL